jgi:glycosyltransferase involved in cell wall biosynthesis
MVLARHRVRRALAEVGRRRPLPRLLTVISSSSGGTPQTNADLARALSNGYEVYVLTSDRRRIALSRILDGRQQPIAEHILSAPLTLARHFSSEYDSLIASWLVEFAIEMVHIRHIGWHGLGLPWVCRQLGIPVVLSFHDFYLICPSVKLLDEKLRYCGGTCTAGPGPCAAELWNPEDTPTLKHEWVNVWRQQTAAMLEAVDGFVASSEGARQTILANFPEIDDRAFEVIPHGRDFKSFSSTAVKPNSARPIRVLAPGNLSIAKGANILAELDALDRDRRLDIHTMGDISAPLVRDSLHHHGKYERDDFVGLVKKIKPSFGLILSLWPETFCHTLTELRAAGIPVIAFDMGAVAERIRAEGGGVLVQERSAAAIYRAILETTADPKTYDALLADIRQWQAGHGRDHDTKAMADRYSRFYSAIFDGRRSFRLPVSR